MVQRHALSLRWSILAILVLGSMLTLFAWNTNAPVMWQVLRHNSDPLGYYQYLPAFFLEGGWQHMTYVHPLENGNGLNLFSMGVALLQAPFFLAAWAWCAAFGVEATGYELPFIFARLLATTMYTATGTVLVVRALLRRFHWITACITGLLVVFATSLYFYTVHAGGMSHAYCFFLMAAIVALTERMVRAPQALTFVALFLSFSLVMLIRPLHALAGLYILFYGAGSAGVALRIRVGWIQTFPKAALGGAFGGVLLWLPQLLYWRATTGSLFVFTYGTKGEGFDWLHPHLLDTLFSLQNGWFIYTPLMVIAMALLLWQVVKEESNARVILLMWALVWYTYSSWWCWWLGGAFGYRGFLDYYAFLAFPLAWGVEKLRSSSRRWFILGLVVMAILVRANVRLALLYEYPWERPSWTWEKLGKVYAKALWF